MVKTLATSVLLFLSLFFATFAQGQSVAPTLGRNNVWTGTNTFNGGIFLPALRKCSGSLVMAGFDTSFNPICVAVSGSGGVDTVNNIAGAVNVENTDTHLQITESGQNLIINCSGCTGGGGSPGGTQGAVQWNTGTGFGGVVITGMVKSNGTGGPAQAVADTDFALPFVLTCGSGIQCPKTGENYTFSLTGSAGTGDVASGLFGQIGGYSGSGTTIGGAPNIYFLNPSWSANQFNGLISRFRGMYVTAWSIGASTTTFTAVNALNVGEQVDMIDFPSSANFFNNNTVTVTAASNTSFTVSSTFGQSTSTGTQNGWATFNVPFQVASSLGVIVIPPGLIDQPSAQIVNGPGVGPAAQFIDTRPGYWFQQASGNGVQCFSSTVFANITAGQNTIFVGSDTWAPYAAGATVWTGQQTGAGQTMTQETWFTHVDHFSYPYLYLTDNAPYNVSANLTISTDNQSAIMAAQSQAGGGIPVWFPQCGMATSTVRWTGTNLIGQQMNATAFNGAPGRDVFQQQDSLPITAWSINATAGTTTFTIPWYSAHSVVIGDVINTQRFAVSTFFNNQNSQIIAQPTPTTVTVNSAFGQSTGSSAEPGLGASTTNVATNALRVENLSFNVNEQIDGSYPWTEYIGSNAGVAEPPYYRPAQEFSEPMNDPRAPGWGTYITNGVANITQNSGVICVPNITSANQPTLGATNVIVFPYQGAGSQAFTLNSSAGSCSTGWTPYTLSSYNGGPTAFPNNAAFTANQAAWFEYSLPQSVGIAIPGSITYPYALYLNKPFPPVPGYEANVSSHGRIIIGQDEFEYMGDQFGGTASANWNITSVANASGSSTTYTGSFSTGGFSCSSNPPVTITGFTHQGNNGTFICTANTSTTFTVTSSTGVAETATASVSSPPPTIYLRTGTTTPNGGAGYAHGTVVSPLNACYGMKDNPWPSIGPQDTNTGTNTINVVHITAWSISGGVATFTANNRLYAGQVGRLSVGGGEEYNIFNGYEVKVLSAGLSTTQFEVNINSADNAGEGTSMTFDGGATPVGATYYGAVCVGNAGIALPEADGNNTTFNGSGFSLAFFNNVAGGSTADDNANQTAWMYQSANYTGYGNTFDNIRVSGPSFGLVQGPASINQHGVRAIGPTSTGQSWKDCTFRTGYPFTIDSMEQSNMDRCDTYSTEVSPYDHTVVGASTGLFIGYTVSEYDGGGVTGVGQFTVKDYNSEPENGNHEEIPPSVVSDGTNITWIGNIFEGGFNIFGGSFQHIIGTQMAVPIFNYGNNNYFDKLYGVNLGYLDQNVYNGQGNFYNWGQFSTCQAQSGAYGALRVCGVGFVQDYNGHDMWASMMGNGLHPTENILGGMILPGEFGNTVYDPTAPWWGSHSECAIGPSNECVYLQWDGFGGYIYIGPHERVTDTQMVMKALVKLKSGTNSPATFRILYSAQNPSSNQTCNPNFSFDSQTFTATSTGWTPIEQAVDFTGFASCVLGVQFDSGSAANVLEVDYFNFVPFATTLYMPLGTHSVGDSCPVAGSFQVERAHFWICKPSSGTTFGPGTWDYYGSPSVP